MTFIFSLQVSASEADILNSRIGQNTNCIFSDQENLGEAVSVYSKLIPNERMKVLRLGNSKIEATETELNVFQIAIQGVAAEKWQSLEASCRQPLCALTHIYQNQEAALRVLILGLRDRLVLSLKPEYPEFDQTAQGERSWIKQNKEIPFSLVEIRQIEYNLSLLPEVVRLRGNTFTIVYRAPVELTATKGNVRIPINAFAKTLGISNLSVSHEIVFGDGTFSANQHSGATIIHEWAHIYRFKNFADAALKNRFWNRFDGLGQWKKLESHSGSVITTTWTPNDRSQFVSAYAMADPDEDFAESFSKYIFEPQLFFGMAQAKYLVVKDFVGEVGLHQYYLKQNQLILSVIPNSELLIKCVQGIGKIGRTVKNEFSLYGLQESGPIYAGYFEGNFYCVNDQEEVFQSLTTNLKCEKIRPNWTRKNLTHVLKLPLKNILGVMDSTYPEALKKLQICQQKGDYRLGCILQDKLEQLRQENTYFKNIELSSWINFKEAILQKYSQNVRSDLQMWPTRIADAILFRVGGAKEIILTCFSEFGHNFYLGLILDQCVGRLSESLKAQGILIEDEILLDVQKALKNGLAVERNLVWDLINEYDSRYVNLVCKTQECFEKDLTEVLFTWRNSGENGNLVSTKEQRAIQPGEAAPIAEIYFRRKNGK